MSVSTKVIIIIIVLVLPLNIMALSSSNAVRQAAMEQVISVEQNLANVYMQNLSVRMKNANSLLFYFVTKDANCIRMMQQKEPGYEYDSAKMKFYSSLGRMADLTDGADGYFYYMKKMEESLFYSQSYEMPIIRDNVLPTFAENPSRLGWHIYEWEGLKYLVFFFDNNNVVYGAWLNLEAIRASILSSVLYENTSVSFSEEAYTVHDDGQIAITASTRDVYLHIGLDRSEILKDTSIRQQLLQIMVGIFLIAIPVLFFSLRYLLLTPLKRMNYAHRQIQQGNMDYRIEEKGRSREYDEAFKRFNHMADKLHFYRIEAYENEIARQKIELRNLQLQVRPHFLLNTFNLIYTLVQRAENESVQDVVIYLSDYFRYIFRSDREMELFGKEMSLIRDYIKTASIRYEGMIEAVFEIPEEIDTVRIPPLLIHNFIENAVKHGIKEGEVLHILLRAEYDGNTVTFLITDDGNGMDEDTLKTSRKLVSGELEPENQNSHMGLLNSYKRLRHYYGEDARIEVESQHGVMTSIRIQFPYSKGGNS